VVKVVIERELDLIVKRYTGHRFCTSLNGVSGNALWNKTA
jgi:hypothetical protein